MPSDDSTKPYDVSPPKVHDSRQPRVLHGLHGLFVVSRHHQSVVSPVRQFPVSTVRTTTTASAGDWLDGTCCVLLSAGYVLVSSALLYPTHGQLGSLCRQLRLETLQKSWDQGFSLSQTTAAPTKPIPIHTWPSDGGVPCVLYVSCVFYPHLSDVRQFIFGEMKPETSGSEAATAELHSQRQRRDVDGH